MVDEEKINKAERRGWLEKTELQVLTHDSSGRIL